MFPSLDNLGVVGVCVTKLVKFIYESVKIYHLVHLI